MSFVSRPALRRVIHVQMNMDALPKARFRRDRASLILPRQTAVCGARRGRRCIPRRSEGVGTLETCASVHQGFGLPPATAGFCQATNDGLRCAK
eukprot:2842313-Pleurochrysis_carterae.AAC.1